MAINLFINTYSMRLINQNSKTNNKQAEKGGFS